MKNPTLQDELSLKIVLQQCNDEEHLNPEKDFEKWKDCLQTIYIGRSSKPNVNDFGSAIYAVWKTKLTRDIFSNALLDIQMGDKPVYTSKAVYSKTNKYYPITITIQVDTTNYVIGKRDNSISVNVFDDNGDPNQGSNELQVNAQLGNTLIWKAISKSGKDTIHLIEFISNNAVNLFSGKGPYKNGDGTFEGELTKTGTECYTFTFKINDSPDIYRWDPYINCIE